MSSVGAFKVRLREQVRAEIAWGSKAGPGIVDAGCNSRGAVFVMASDGSQLGVRPGEFEYITLPPAGIPLAMTPEAVRTLADQHARLRAALLRYVEEYAGIHEEDCPEDDTCACVFPAEVNAILAETEGGAA